MGAATRKVATPTKGDKSFLFIQTKDNIYRVKINNALRNIYKEIVHYKIVN